MPRTSLIERFAVPDTLIKGLDRRLNFIGFYRRAASPFRLPSHTRILLPRRPIDALRHFVGRLRGRQHVNDLGMRPPPPRRARIFRAVSPAAMAFALEAPLACSSRMTG